MNGTKVQKGQAVSIGTSLGEAGRLNNENYVMLMVSDKQGKFSNPQDFLAANTKESEWKTAYDSKIKMEPE
jgi:hypothetical protein